MFGRKTFGTKHSAPQPPPASGAPRDMPGHRNVLEHLDREAAANPVQRQQVAGRIVFDLVCEMIASDRGVRMEDLVAVLASAGGFACAIAGLQDFIALEGREQPNDLVWIEGKDRLQYIFGDLPNRYLLESEHALLSLAMGAAAGLGASLSLDDAHSAFKHCASTVGAPEFGVPRLPAENMPGDHPVNYVIHLWSKIQEALDLYEVKPSQRPAALGFALQQAITFGKDAISPKLAAIIAIECAVPTSKIQPGQLEKWKAHWLARGVQRI
jgi:hypothetical protein